MEWYAMGQIARLLVLQFPGDTRCAGRRSGTLGCVRIQARVWRLSDDVSGNARPGVFAARVRGVYAVARGEEETGRARAKEDRGEEEKSRESGFIINV